MAAPTSSPQNAPTSLRACRRRLRIMYSCWPAMLKTYVSALEHSGRFKGVFAQPAAGNAGTALGAALSVWSDLPGDPQKIDGGGYCFGPSFSAAEVKQVLENCKLRFKVLATTPE